MRSNGLATILLLIPVLTVPALAIFGIPQFAPVVASPLDEGRDNFRESRVGNSAKLPQDDLFADIEGFGSEPSIDDAASKRRNTTTKSSEKRRDPSRHQKDSQTTSWGDDLPTDSSEIRDQRQQSSDLESEESPFHDSAMDSPSSPSTRFSKRTTPGDKPSRERVKPAQVVKNAGAVRVAKNGTIDNELVQAGFEEDAEPPASRPAPIKNRQQSSDSKNGKRRESSTEPLSWATAVERLNQLDIRNFRLEQGSQMGQFIFICMYTPQDNPRVSHRFEAEADQPLKAVQNVLDQIVEWQQKR